MTLTARAWLPANSALPRAAQASLEATVDGWSREWFAQEPLRVLGIFARVAHPRGELRRMARHECEGGLAILLSPDGLVGLGSKVLGIMLGQERTPADLVVLAKVGDECLDDLKRRLGGLFRVPREAAWSAEEGAAGGPGVAHRLDIGCPKRSLVLTLELDETLFATFARAALPAVRTAPLGDSRAAFAGLPVHVGAALGACRISAAELAGLAPGDVLVLDTDFDAELPLAISGRAASGGRCAITQAGDTLALRILHAPA